MQQININDSATETAAKLNSNFNELSSGSTDKQQLFIGQLEQNGSWVRQKDVTTIVDWGIEYTFNLPADIVAKVEHGTTRELGTTSANKFDGDTIVFSSSMAQRISFARYDNGAVASLSVADAERMIADGSISVTYVDNDVFVHNADKEYMLAALSKMTFNEVFSNSSSYWYKKAPLIAHTSDLHGDAQRMWNMCRFAKRFGIDTCVVSGDAVLQQIPDGNNFVFDAAKKAGVHVCMAMGNHEVYPQASGTTDATNFNNYFAGHNVVTDFGYQLPLDSNDEALPRAYYHHDFADKKIRIIVLDSYDGGIYGGTGQAGRLSQDQVDWFIETLRSTPQNYGVIVVMHSPESSLTLPNDLSKFQTKTPTSDNDGDNYSYGLDGAYNDSSKPICHIIDAFINDTGGWSSYKKSGSQVSESVSFTADFTGANAKNTGVEFICYLNGHIHQDRVGYVNATGITSRQLNINITSGNGHPTYASGYGFGGVDDIPRRGTGATQDAFNVYAIDRANKQVRILRIGSNVKKDFTMRDYLIVDYGQSNS